jgi:hypothetical protein
VLPVILFQPLQQGLKQPIRIDRLGDVIVHARVDADLAILIEGVGGHGE